MYTSIFEGKPNNLELYRYFRINYFQKATDLNYKLKEVVRARMNIALAYNWKGVKTAELLGASISEVWNHLEKQFQPGMTRKNHGLWHIDHIKPCAAFDFSFLEQQKKCFHYTNLRPLWAKDNLKKGGQ